MSEVAITTDEKVLPEGWAYFQIQDVTQTSPCVDKNLSLTI